jgi:hypothetical protein
MPVVSLCAHSRRLLLFQRFQLCSFLPKLVGPIASLARFPDVSLESHRIYQCSKSTRTL